MLDTNATINDPRTQTYRLIASLFARELSESQIENLRNGDAQNLLIQLQKYPDVASLATYLATFFRDVEDPHTAFLDLAESYAWLFHGVGGAASAPLYASVYTDRRGATHGAIERSFLTLLSDHGLCPKNHTREPCDHLAALLEFVVWLSETDTLSPDERQSLQEVFTRDYLLAWLPSFVRQCRIGDRMGFYTALAENTLSFITADYAQVAAARS